LPVSYVTDIGALLPIRPAPVLSNVFFKVLQFHLLRTHLTNTHPLIYVNIFSIHLCFSILGTLAKFRESSISFVMSVCPSARPSAPTGWIFIQFDICPFFRKFFVKIQVSLKSDKNSGTLREDQYTLSIVSRSPLFRMRNVFRQEL